MSRSPKNQPALAKLVLNSAEERVEAPLLNGYYMIGRDQECQIRPRSSSVADRHCLIEHRDGVIRVFDLESESGTFVNGAKQETHSWRFLVHGDELRCGKITFNVVVPKSIVRKPSDAVPKTVSAATFAQQTPPLSQTNDISIQNDVVAELLPDGDIAARRAHYDSIRDGSGNTRIDFAVVGPSDVAEIESDDVDALNAMFEDDTVTSTDRRLEAPYETRTSTESPPKLENTKAPLKPVQQVKLPKSKRPKAPKKLRTSSFSFPSVGFDTGESGVAKLVGAIVLTLAILAFFGYQVKQFAEPPQVRIIQEDL